MVHTCELGDNFTWLFMCGCAFPPGDHLTFTQPFPLRGWRGETYRNTFSPKPGRWYLTGSVNKLQPSCQRWASRALSFVHLRHESVSACVLVVPEQNGILCFTWLCAILRSLPPSKRVHGVGFISISVDNKSATAAGDRFHPKSNAGRWNLEGDATSRHRPRCNIVAVIEPGAVCVHWYAAL